jgi:hypothetical protein
LNLASGQTALQIAQAMPEAIAANLNPRAPKASSGFFQKSRITGANNFGGMRASNDTKVTKIGRKFYRATARSCAFIESLASGPHCGVAAGDKAGANNLAANGDGEAITARFNRSCLLG